MQWKKSKYENSECVFVASGIQHEERLLRNISSSVVCLVLQYFCTLTHNRHDIQGKVTENKMCFDFLYNLCLKYFSS